MKKTGKTVYMRICVGMLAVLMAAAALTGCKGKKKEETAAETESVTTAEETRVTETVNETKEAEDASGSTAAIADEPWNTDEKDQVIPASVYTGGTIKDIMSDSIVIDCSDSNPELGTLELMITDGTYIHSVKYGATDFAKLSVGKDIAAWCSEKMTRSVPAQAEAYAIVLDSSAKGKAVKYCVVTGIDMDKSDNINLITNQDLVLVPNNDTVIKLSSDGSTLAANKIKKSDRLLVSYSMMTMSIPAVTNPEEIIVIR